MTIHHTAYQTTATSGFVMRRTVEGVQNALLEGELARIEGTTIRAVEGGSVVADAIPAFSHPLLVDDSHKNPVLVVDLRPFGRWDALQKTFQTRNDLERRLTEHRAKLNQVWLSESPVLMRDFSTLPIAVFSAWIAEAIARRFALEPMERFKLQILSAIYYHSLFHDEAELSEQDKLRLTGSLTRILRASSEDVLSVLDLHSVVPNITHFAKVCAEVTGSVRLQGLNVGVIYDVLGGTWFGTNAKENVAVALEHPPTWVAILVASYAERSFKNSAITRMIEGSRSLRDAGKDFLRSALNLIATTLEG